jgi:hypothetical protein
MAQYPTVGGSSGTWGTETRAFHAVTKDLATGLIKNEALQSTSTAPVADAALANKKYVDDNSRCKAWASVDSTGAIQGTGFNVTPSRDSEGVYTLTWGTDFANTTYAVMITPETSQATAVYQVTAKLAGSCKVRFFTAPNGTAVVDRDFGLAAFGTQ